MLVRRHRVHGIAFKPVTAVVVLVTNLWRARVPFALRYVQF